MTNGEVTKRLAQDGEPMLFPEVRTAYAEEPVSNAKSMADMLGTRAVKVMKPTRRTERGDLITYFHERLTDKKGKRFPIGFIASKLSLFDLPALYYLKSTCEDAERRGKPFGAIFWWSIKPK